jgi:hypothetical protein
MVAEALPLLSQNASVHLKRPNIHSAEARTACGKEECDQQADLVVVAAHIRSRWACGVEDGQAPEGLRYATRATEEAGLLPDHLVTPSLLLKAEVVADMLESESLAKGMFVVAL